MKAPSSVSLIYDVDQAREVMQNLFPQLHREERAFQPRRLEQQKQRGPSGSRQPSRPHFRRRQVLATAAEEDEDDADYSDGAGPAIGEESGEQSSREQSSEEKTQDVLAAELYSLADYMQGSDGSGLDEDEYEKLEDAAAKVQEAQEALAVIHKTRAKLQSRKRQGSKQPGRGGNKGQGRGSSRKREGRGGGPPTNPPRSSRSAPSGAASATGGETEDHKREEIYCAEETR